MSKLDILSSLIDELAIVLAGEGRAFTLGWLLFVLWVFFFNLVMVLLTFLFVCLGFLLFVLGFFCKQSIRALPFCWLFY